MNLYTLLAARSDAGHPVRVGLIGAGKFGSMVLSQAQRIAGYHMVAVADLNVGKARESLDRVGWPAERYAAKSAGEAVKTGTTFVTDDVAALLACEEIECVIEATGHPIAGTRHALAAIEAGKHVVMVNVEADVMVGPILAEKARQKGLIYSMAYGDQPALICELVDWARATGFEVTAAGKGMNFEPRYRYSTPDTVWSFFGWTDEEVAKGDFNPKMYNSFTDGTKAAIEMAAVANGTGLDCPDDGLAFPPAGLHDLAKVFRPAADGGRMARIRPGRHRRQPGAGRPRGVQQHPLRRLRHLQGAQRIFARLLQAVRPADRPVGLVWLDVAAVPHHRPGDLGQRALGGAAQRGDRLLEGVPRRRRRHRQEGHAAGRDARRRRRLAVWANAIPATRSLELGALPIGLAHNVKLKRPIKKDQIVSFDDVELVNDLDVVAVRREMEDRFRPAAEAAA